MQSKAHIRAADKYNLENYERIAVRCKKGRKALYEKLAEKRGLSLNGLISSLLEREVQKEFGTEE